MDHQLTSRAPDVILRSGDGQEFKTHKYLLSLASPVFSTMFTLPQGSVSSSSNCDVTKDGIPVVDMLGDNGKVLQHLLEMCNPTYLYEQKPLKTLEEWKKVYTMAQKYEMRGVEYYLRMKLEWFVEKEPLRIFALAARFRNPTIAQKAAMSCLTVPFREWDVFPEMESITGGDLQRLHNYYIRCGESATAIVQTYDEETCRYVWFNCTECAASKRSFSHWETVAVGYSDEMDDVELEDQHHKGEIRLWWWQFAEELCSALKEKPRGETVKNSTELIIKALARANECSVCKETASDHIAGCIRHLAERIDRRISEITSKTVFFKS